MLFGVGDERPVVQPSLTGIRDFRLQHARAVASNTNRAILPYSGEPGQAEAILRWREGLFYRPAHLAQFTVPRIPANSTYGRIIVISEGRFLSSCSASLRSALP